uniref:PX domain-containing protein n=1 Tax=Globisporangium ultimum (strain ATCC 200006 / CBS 805.95 / DAOM BR144) TaxID=431595 RepID=K3W766_GLOUD
MESAIEDSSYSKIACGPESIAPKVLVGIIDVADVNWKTFYVIRCEMIKSTFEWTVQRRYSEFLELKDDLVAFFDRCMVPQCFGCRWFSQSLSGFEFPRRHLLSSREPEVIQHRKTGLDQFARLLAAHTFSTIPKCVSCSKWPFVRVRDFFLENATIPPNLSFKIIRSALEPENFSAIADPSKSKIEFRKGNGIMKMLQVEKPVFSMRMQHEQACADQIKKDQQKAMQRKMSFHGPGYRAPTHPRAVGGGQTTTIISIEEIDANDDDNNEQEGVLEDELDMTGVEMGISMDSSARRLAPLRSHSSQDLWEPWEFAPPAKAKSG